MTSFNINNRANFFDKLNTVRKLSAKIKLSRPRICPPPLHIHLQESSVFDGAKLMADRYIMVESWESFLGYLVTVKGTVHFVQ